MFCCDTCMYQIYIVYKIIQLNDISNEIYLQYTLKIQLPTPSYKRYGSTFQRKGITFLRINCAKFGWNLPRDSGEEVKNVNSLQTDRQKGDGQ